MAASRPDRARPRVRVPPEQSRKSEPQIHADARRWTLPFQGPVTTTQARHTVAGSFRSIRLRASVADDSCFLLQHILLRRLHGSRRPQWPPCATACQPGRQAFRPRLIDHAITNAHDHGWVGEAACDGGVCDDRKQRCSRPAARPARRQELRRGDCGWSAIRRLIFQSGRSGVPQGSVGSGCCDHM